MHSKNSPLKIEAFRQDEMNDFILHNQKEIVSILRNIAQHRAQVALYYGENKLLASRVLSADENGVWVDASRDADENREIERSNNIVLVSTHNKIKVQWRASEAMQALYQVTAAFFLPLPTKLLRLQRRDCYRLLCSPPDAVECTIHLPRAQKPNKHSFRVMDISIGGIALADANEDLKLTEGAVYQDCQIELPWAGTLHMEIRVMHIMESMTHSGAVSRRAGCSFVNPSQASTRLLQQYITLAQQPAIRSKPAEV